MKWRSNITFMGYCVINTRNIYSVVKIQASEEARIYKYPGQSPPL